MSDPTDITGYDGAEMAPSGAFLVDHVTSQATHADIDRRREKQ